MRDHIVELECQSLEKHVLITVGRGRAREIWKKMMIMNEYNEDHALLLD